MKVVVMKKEGWIEKLIERASQKWFIKPRKDDYPILSVLFFEGKLKQGTIEKGLKKRNMSQAHSTVTSRLSRLVRDGLVLKNSESDGFNYFEISPIGVSVLVAIGEIEPHKMLEFFQDHAEDYYELLIRVQPNLREQLNKCPAFIVHPVTEDLWIFHYIMNKERLKLEVLEYSLHGKEPSEPMQFAMRPLCLNKIEVEGKGICVKQRKPCNLSPQEILFKCDLIKSQMQHEWQRLKVLQETT